MSKLPRQLQRQAEDVERIEREMAEAKAATTPPDEETPPPETPPEQVSQDETPPPATPPPSAPEPQVNEWEQRYRTLEGKYRAEVPRLHQELKELKATLEDLRKQPPPQQPPAQETPREKKRLVTDKDAETFGPDLLDLIKRQAQEIADEMVSTRETQLESKLESLRSENAKLREQITGVSKTQEANAQDVYLSKLSATVPDWAEINTDQRFLAWLAEVDPMSGHSRQAYLDHAFQHLDVERTATIFNAFKKLTAPPQQPAPQKSELQRQVTPGKSKSAPTPAADPNTKIWDSSEIDRFYQEVRMGRIKPDEAARIEKEIDSAVVQGRVR